MSFSGLKLNQNLLKALADLSYTEATPIQQQAIPAVLAKRDIMGRAQTGTGKTAAFALPLLHLLCMNQPHTRTIRALVLVPTRELALQVFRSFEQYGKHCSLITASAYGGVSINPQIEKLKEGVDILVATPGRLLELMEKGAVNLERMQSLVFDEADRMLDMGFADEIKRILDQVPAKRQTLLFSATFDDALVKLANSMLKEPKVVEVDSRNTAAEKIKQVIYAVDKSRKRELVSHLIGARNYHQVLIFMRTKQGCDAFAKEMCKDGIRTLSIHGDKSQGAREKALEEFKAGKARALVATDVASRGLDIRQLQYVINVELPFNPEDYIHRIGRTGRAGGEGLAISLLSTDEHYLHQEIEIVLGERLAPQWLPGYEPDLANDDAGGRKNNRVTQKRKVVREAGAEPSRGAPRGRGNATSKGPSKSKKPFGGRGRRG